VTPVDPHLKRYPQRRVTLKHSREDHSACADDLGKLAARQHVEITDELGLGAAWRCEAREQEYQGEGGQEGREQEGKMRQDDYHQELSTERTTIP